MKVHSFLLFKNGSYTEISKALDFSAHNHIMSPATHHLVEDNYITFFCPEDCDNAFVYEYARAHELHLIEDSDANKREAIAFADARQLKALQGYKTVRIHYFTDWPIHWEINPENDHFIFDGDDLGYLMMCN